MSERGQFVSLRGGGAEWVPAPSRTYERRSGRVFKLSAERREYFREYMRRRRLKQRSDSGLPSG